jgi:hypothetical protein
MRQLWAWNAWANGHEHVHNDRWTVRYPGAPLAHKGRHRPGANDGCAGITGTFALVCELINRQGQVVGQGRGVAELRETSTKMIRRADVERYRLDHLRKRRPRPKGDATRERDQ